MRIRPALLAPLVCLSVMTLGFLGGPRPTEPKAPATEPKAPATEPKAPAAGPCEFSLEAARVQSRTLLGLWQATHPSKEGDPVRFYYFHDGGIGLVRYGKMGLTYTRSFHWQVRDEKLVLVFTKTGAHHQVEFRLSEDSLHLPRDPAFPGDHRYQRDVRPRGGSLGANNAAPTADHPLARLWIEPTKDRNGSEGFRMYQLQAPTIDGRGVGWYHEGDMSDWSTETLTYRRTGDTFELVFPVRGERVSTPIRLNETEQGRTLTLSEDPRNFWHPRTYGDGGPGFTVSVAGLPLPYRVPGHVF